MVCNRRFGLCLGYVRVMVSVNTNPNRNPNPIPNPKQHSLYQKKVVVVTTTKTTTMVMMAIVTIKFIIIDIAPKSVFFSGEGAAVHKLKTGG